MQIQVKLHQVNQPVTNLSIQVVKNCIVYIFKWPSSVVFLTWLVVKVSPSAGRELTVETMITVARCKKH